MATWTSISPEDARAHPLFGFGGWLAVFAIGMVLGEALALADSARDARALGMSLGAYFSANPGVDAAYFIGAICTALTLWFLFTRDRQFRWIAVGLMVAGFPAGVAAMLALQPVDTIDGAGVGFASISWALTTCVWSAYLLRSRRVRVTFERQVRVEPSRPDRRAAASKAATPSDEAWAEALAELDGPSRLPGVWARCFAQANGDENAARAAYLTARAEQIHESRVASA